MSQIRAEESKTLDEEQTTNGTTEPGPSGQSVDQVSSNCNTIKMTSFFSISVLIYISYNLERVNLS